VFGRPALEGVAIARRHDNHAIDGKTLRRSFDRAKGQSALHRVHAWATANHLLLGQVAVDPKSNEITAIPKLLRMLEISGAIVTIDAMGCPKEIAHTIRDRKADDILALKANHERLFEQVVAFWEAGYSRQLKGPDIRDDRQWNESHGRFEARRCWATSDLDWLEGREAWEGLQSVVFIESERFIGEALSVETRYYLSSLPNDAKLLNQAIRSHWAVEIPQPEGPRSNNLCAIGGAGYHRGRRPVGVGRVERQKPSGPRRQLMLDSESICVPPRPRFPRRIH
jgi:predicted transposase YbfD/YdcC